MITGKQLVEKLYSEGWELEQREYGLLSKMKGFISKRNLEKYYRYKGELNRLKNEKSKIQGELSNLDERAPKNMKLERAIQREAINENSFVTRYAENSNVDIKDKKIKEVLKNSINNSDRVSERDKRKLSKLIDNRDHAIYYNRNQGGPASLAHEVGHIKGEKDSIKNRIANSDSIRGSFNKADKRDGDTYFESDSNNSKFPKLKSWKRKLIDKRLASRRGHKVDNITYTGMGPAYQNNKIYTSGTKAADVLSHEMGHAHYDKRKVKSVSDAIGKVAHKAYLKTGGMLNHTVLAPTAGIIAGVRSGKKAAEKEAAGEKESKLSRHSGWASGLAVQSPGLVSEAMASKHGLDLMKKAGASKKLMKASRKNLGVALGTYAGVAVTNAGMSELARGIAYKKKKKKLEKEKDKKKDDK